MQLCLADKPFIGYLVPVGIEGFKIVSHTADLAIQVHSATLSGLLQQAISGLLCLLTDSKKVILKKTAKAEISFESPEEFLVHALNKALYLFDAEGFFTKTVNVDFGFQNPEDIITKKLTTDKIFKANLFFCGEQIDKKRHSIKHCVKAVTYHGLKISSNGHFLTATIILDD